MQFMATPLLWSEVTKICTPKMFPMDEGMKRIKNGLLPLKNYLKIKQTAFKKY
ncbi:hypothetical protein KHA80_20740 [Anaerobacillus sp. HL2]|nr:hypothetical protein KHA80_20740 [Anaerobacillus sp. HL2]